MASFHPSVHLTDLFPLTVVKPLHLDLGFPEMFLLQECEWGQEGKVRKIVCVV